MIDLIMQGKGGVGKSYVAWLLAQFYADMGRAPLCFDTDPVQESLAEFEDLKAEAISLLMPGGGLDVDSIDDMFQRVMKADRDAVIDNGAASFLPMMSYLVEGDTLGLIAGAGKQLRVHVVMVGGPAAKKTADGLEAVMTSFPENVRVVVWINEFFGKVEVNGKTFTDLKFYEANKERLSLVRLPLQNPQTTGHALAKILGSHGTFAAALEDMNQIAAQRIVAYRRLVWSQLEKV